MLLFVHEMGHVIEAKRQGLPVSAPLFIPFLGAMITMKEMPQDAWNEAKVGIAGPMLGSAAAFALWIAGEAADSNSLKAIAFLGFLINLFNLLPVVPLDGGRIVGALHPALWLVGFLALLGLVIVRPNPLLILILVFAGLELRNRWQTRNHPELQSYYTSQAFAAGDDRGALLRARDPPRGRNARNARPDRPVQVDGRRATAREPRGRLSRRTSLSIAREFRAGFAEVRQDRDRPAVSIFGSARVARGLRRLPAARDGRPALRRGGLGGDHRRRRPA